MNNKISQEVKQALADLARRQAMDRLQRDGCCSSNRRVFLRHLIGRINCLATRWLYLAAVAHRSSQMTNLIARFRRDESAATAIEYGLIAAGIALAIIAAVNGLGTNLNTMFSSINTSLK
jgi:pilus assembly protein Flp/PilA